MIYKGRLIPLYKLKTMLIKSRDEYMSNNLVTVQITYINPKTNTEIIQNLNITNSSDAKSHKYGGSSNDYTWVLYAPCSNGLWFGGYNYVLLKDNTIEGGQIQENLDFISNGNLKEFVQSYKNAIKLYGIKTDNPWDKYNNGVENQIHYKAYLGLWNKYDFITEGSYYPYIPEGKTINDMPECK